MDDKHRVSRVSNRWVRISMAGFAALVVLSLAVPAMTPDADTDALETEIHEEINDRRLAEGVAALEHSEQMSTYAAGYSQRMADNGFFAHTPPTGPPKKQVRCRATGENLVTIPDTSGDESELATEIVDKWMNSKPHRKNILNSGWRAEGIGVHIGGETVVTQRFCG